MERVARDFKIVIHGVDHEQYFPGDGIANGPFEDCATGIGDSLSEAYSDAVDILAQSDWNMDWVVQSRGGLECSAAVKTMVGEDEEGCHVYVTIKVRE